MVQTGRRIILVVRVPKTQFLQDSPRGCIAGIVPRKERFHSESVKRIPHHRSRRLRRIPLTPKGRPQMDPNLANPFLGLVRSESAASGILTSGKQEDRPVLDAVRPHGRDLPGEPLLHLLPGERSPDELNHLRIAPEVQCQLNVRLRPRAESKALALEKIRGRLRSSAAVRILRDTHEINSLWMVTGYGAVRDCCCRAPAHRTRLNAHLWQTKIENSSVVAGFLPKSLYAFTDVNPAPLR